MVLILSPLCIHASRPLLLEDLQDVGTQLAVHAQATGTTQLRLQ